MPTQEDGKLSIVEKVGYGLGDTASNFFWKTFEYFLLYFYTDVFGLSAKAAGTMLLVTRIWDAINDPLVGYLADRTRTRWGRFRPYLIWGAIPFAISGMVTFYTPNLGPTGKLIYAYVTYLLVMTCYTAINIPYGALMGVISPSSLERTSVSTYRFVLAFVGGIIVQYFMLDMVAWFGQTSATVDGVSVMRIDEQRGYFWTMVVFSCTAVVLFWITFATTRERVQPESGERLTLKADFRFVLTSWRLHQTFIAGLSLLLLLATEASLTMFALIVIGYGLLSLFSFAARTLLTSDEPESKTTSTLAFDFSDLVSNGPWLVLLIFGFFQLLGAFIRGGAILYYFKYYCGDPGLASTFLVTGSLASIAGMVMTKTATRWFGKRRLMMMVNTSLAVSAAAFFFLDPDQIGWMLAVHIIGMFLAGPGPVLLWAMYADVVDYSEWRTHRRATGLVFSAATFSHKFGCAIGAAVAGLLLDGFGYLPPINGIDQIQSETVMAGLRWMMSIIPAFFYVAAGLSLLAYRVDETMLLRIESDLAARRTAT